MSSPVIGVSGSGSPSLQLLWFCFSGAALKLQFRCRLSQARWFIPAIPTLPIQGWDERVATNLSYIVSSRSAKSVDRDPVLKIKPNKARKKNQANQDKLINMYDELSKFNWEGRDLFLRWLICWKDLFLQWLWAQRSAGGSGVKLIWELALPGEEGKAWEWITVDGSHILWYLP